MKEIIRKIHAINAECRDCDRRHIPRHEQRARLDALYPELEEEIARHADPQDASDLIQALYALIYHRSFSEQDRGPKLWRERLWHHTQCLIDAYHRHPRLPLTAYIFHLRVHASLSRDPETERTDRAEMKRLMDQALERLQTEDLPLQEQLDLSYPRLTAQGPAFIDPRRDRAWTKIFARLGKTECPEESSEEEKELYRRFQVNLRYWYLK